jgi:hypothetical protein
LLLPSPPPSASLADPLRGAIEPAVTGASAMHIEADADLGVTSRVLDLLVALDRFPETLHLQRDGDRLTLDLGFNRAETPVLQLLARMRQIPGVRRALPRA